MAMVFKVTPKRIKRANGLVLTPDMSVVVTTQQQVEVIVYIKNQS